MKPNPFQPKADAPRSAGAATGRAILIVAGLAAALFLLTLLFVLREAQHQRELYRMSRQVARAEEELARWREKQRLEELRTARLLAALNTRADPRPEPEPAYAQYALAMR